MPPCGEFINYKNFNPAFLVQAWLPEADFNVTDKDLENLNSMRRPEIKVIRPILWKLAHKITLATQLQTQSVLSGTAMQVSLETNK